jgi:hypothetical protein
MPPQMPRAPVQLPGPPTRRHRGDGQHEGAGEAADVEPHNSRVLAPLVARVRLLAVFLVQRVLQARVVAQRRHVAIPQARHHHGDRLACAGGRGGAGVRGRVAGGKLQGPLMTGCPATEWAACGAGVLGPLEGRRASGGGGQQHAEGRGGGGGEGGADLQA